MIFGSETLSYLPCSFCLGDFSFFTDLESHSYVFNYGRIEYVQTRSTQKSVVSLQELSLLTACFHPNLGLCIYLTNPHLHRSVCIKWFQFRVAGAIPKLFRDEWGPWYWHAGAARYPAVWRCWRDPNRKADQISRGSPHLSGWARANISGAGLRAKVEKL